MPAAERARPVLLIVDDEARILSALRRSFRREGYEILTADSAEAALKVLADRRVDLVLSDHKMPKMSGLDLFAEVSRRHPETQRVLLTGWTEAVPPERLEALGVAKMVPKPWDDAQLKELLRGLLQRG